MKKNIFRAGSSIVVLAASVYLLFKNVDLSDINSALAGADWVLVLVSFVFLPAVFLLKTYRWKLLLEPIKKGVKFKNLFNILSISQLATTILPFRAGDLIQIFYLGSKENISKATVLSSMAAYQALDLLLTFLLFTIVSFNMLIPNALKKSIAVAGVFFVVCLVLYIYFMNFIENTATRYFAFLGGRISSLNRGLREILNPGVLLGAALITVLIAVLGYVHVLIIFKAFGVSTTLIAVLAYITIPVIVTIIPSTPGFIGVWDVAAVSVLVWFDIGKALALSVSVTHHFLGLIVVAVFGIIAILMEGYQIGISGIKNTPGKS